MPTDVIEFLLCHATAGVFVWLAESNFGLLHLFEAPIWIELLLSILVLDLIAQYTVHFLLHKVPAMWRLHIVHHSDKHVDVTTVRFRQFDRRLAESYLRLDEPYDCAGSFKIEGAGFVLFESVRTDDPTALIGLPMIWIADRLLSLGYLQP